MNAKDMCALLDDMALVPYRSGGVDLREHALQTAWHAMSSGADDTLVVAALLHDVGRHPWVGAQYPGLAHEEAGRRFLWPVLGARVAWLAGAHVEAGAYLAATTPGYRGGGSEALAPESVRRFLRHPWSLDAIALRRWDDRSLVPGHPALSGEGLPDRIEALISAAVAH